jgi:hypothetical protein
MLMVYEDDTWGPPRVVNPPGRNTGNVVPHAISFRDDLYIAWSTGDDGISIGTDLDVVMREFDGQRFGDIVPLSPDDTHVNQNPSDDGSVSLAIFEGNLYAVFDAIFSPVTDGPNKDVLFRYIGYDLDGDDHDDGVDAFPRDPAEWDDTDGDGVGDNRDAYPTDPDRWKKDGDGEEKPGLTTITAGIAGIFVVAAIGYLLFARRTKPPNET